MNHAPRFAPRLRGWRTVVDRIFSATCVAFVAFLIVVMLSGCTEDQVRAAQNVEAKVSQALDIAIKNREEVKQALSAVIDIYEKNGSAESRQNVEGMRSALARADESVKVIADNYAVAKAASDAAIKSAAAGGTVLDILLGVGAVLLPTGLGWLKTYLALKKERAATDTARTGLKLASAFADEVEKLLPTKVDPDLQVMLEVAKNNAKQSQIAAGAHDVIQEARGKS